MSTPERVIKRYSNRKLYDQERRSYVTLRDVAEIVREGIDVRVIDSRSGADLTRQTLVQIILDEQRESERGASVPSLLGMIREGTDQLAGFVRRHAADPSDGLAEVRQELERRIAGLIGSGRITWDEGARLRQELAATVQQLMTDARDRLEQSLTQRLSALQEGAEPELSRLWDRIRNLDWSRQDPDVEAEPSSPDAPEPTVEVEPVAEKKTKASRKKTSKSSAARKRTTTSRKTSRRGGKRS